MLAQSGGPLASALLRPRGRGRGQSAAKQAAWPGLAAPLRWGGQAVCACCLRLLPCGHHMCASALMLAAGMSGVNKASGSVLKGARTSPPCHPSSGQAYLKVVLADTEVPALVLVGNGGHRDLEVLVQQLGHLLR